MKYLSLIAFMKFYGNFIKSNHMVVVNHDEITQSIDEESGIRKPYSILPPESSDGMNHITITKPGKIRWWYGSNMTESFHLPPILEIEWLKTKNLDLSEEMFGALTQLSYFMISHVMAHHAGNWVYILESVDVIMELKDLEDTAVVLSKGTMPYIKLPNYRSWNNLFIYGPNIKNLATLCMHQSEWFKEVYWHLPVILSMFMVDYFGNELKYWGSALRIGTETQIMEMMETELYNNLLVDSDEYTYGLYTVITAKDRELYEAVLSEIYRKLVDVNKDLGVVSFSNYSSITGPDISRASVRLSGINIVWDDEIQRAEEEKENVSEISE